MDMVKLGDELKSMQGSILQLQANFQHLERVVQLLVNAFLRDEKQQLIADITKLMAPIKEAQARMEAEAAAAKENADAAALDVLRQQLESAEEDDKGKGESAE